MYAQAPPAPKAKIEFAGNLGPAYNRDIEEIFKKRVSTEGKSGLTSDPDYLALLKLQRNQRLEYDNKILLLREKARENNRIIAELKAQIIHYQQ